MSKLQQLALVLSVASISIASLALGINIARLFATYSARSTETTCLQYEQAGVINKGSCNCVKKIYRTWEESYDWKDACEILHSRDNMAKE